MIRTAEHTPKRVSKRALPLLKPLLTLLVLVLVVFAFHYIWVVFKTTSLQEMRAALLQFSPLRLGIAVVLVAMTYSTIIGYDFFALRMAGSRLSLKQIAYTSFIGDTFNANLALSAFTGSAVKLRFYLKQGEKLPVIIRAISSYTIAYWTGFSVLLAGSGLAARFIGNRTPVPLLNLPVFNILIAAASTISIGYITVCLNSSIRRRLPTFIPHGNNGMKLLFVGIADWLLSSMVFFTLLPHIRIHDFPAFINVYLISHTAGMISQSPGGIGVFESVSLLMNRSFTHSSMLVTLLAFRMLFFIFPLCGALLLMGTAALRRKIIRHRTAPHYQPASGSLPAAELPCVSVVVPAYNEERFLSSCLQALQQQTYRGRYDIIVVNNASTDATGAIARSFGCRVIDEPKKGYVHAITTGFDSAGSAIIASTDADTIVPPDWIEKIAANLSDPATVACGGVFRFYDGSPVIKLIGALFGRLNYHIAGANMAIRKEAYRRAGGFTENVNLGADVEIGLRLKRIGTVRIDRSLTVATSSRRFSGAFWKTVFMYYLNDAALFLFKRPVFHSFQDYRTPQTVPMAQRRLLPAAITLFIVLLSGWLLEVPFHMVNGTVHANEPPLKAIALTFDDGPGKSTSRILDILARYNARATFFVIGKNVIAHQDLCRRIVDGGNEIGNHTYTHSLTCSVESAHAFKRELDRAGETIRLSTGKMPLVFRPPRGWRNPWMVRECAADGLRMAQWTIDSQDWRHVPAGHILRNVFEKIRPGSIILFHDRLNTGSDHGIYNTIAALPQVIDSLSRAGYTFVTVSELLEMTPDNLCFGTMQQFLQPGNQVE